MVEVVLANGHAEVVVNVVRCCWQAEVPVEGSQKLHFHAQQVLVVQCHIHAERVCQVI